jgi:hypothetical protein
MFPELCGNTLRLLAGDVVSIQVGEKKIAVHQTLLNFVTDTFNDLPQNFDVGPENVEIFPKFLAWLYSTNRCQQLEQDDADGLISLYIFGITSACETLKADALHHLLRIIGKVSQVCLGYLAFLTQSHYP